MSEEIKNTRSGGISVDTEHIFPIIKKWLYSEKDIFLREIVSNASDAITKLRRLESLGLRESTDEKYKITVTLDSQLGTLTVSDNGIGMNVETIGRCTEPFFVNGEIPGKKRMGLGLTLAHHFAVKSGGRFKIKSTIGEGTSVSILLPVAGTDKTELSVGSFYGEIPGGTFSPVEIVLSSLR